MRGVVVGVVVLAAAVAGCGLIAGLPPEARPEGPVDASLDASESGPDAGEPSDARDAAQSPDDGGSADGDASVGSVVDSGVPGWIVLYDNAIDVAVGATDDAIWVVDAPPQSFGGSDHKLLAWNPGARRFEDTHVLVLRADVTPSGPCIVEPNFGISVSSDGGLVHLTGGVGHDIGCGSTGDVWVISDGAWDAGADAGDRKVFKWLGTFDPNPFAQAPNAHGVALDVGPDGVVWIAHDTAGIVTLASFDAQPVEVPFDGRAIDVGVGADGTAYAAGTTTAGVPMLFRYSKTTSRFESYVAMNAVRVSAGPTYPVVVLADGRVVTPAH